MTGLPPNTTYAVGLRLYVQVIPAWWGNWMVRELDLDRGAVFLGTHESRDVAERHALNVAFRRVTAGIWEDA